MQIDARNKACPGPVMMAHDALAAMIEGSIEVLVDNEEAAVNLRDYAAQYGMTSVQTREGRDWKVLISKSSVCEKNAEPERKKGLMVIVGTDGLGKDEALGRMLMKGFLETMNVHNQLPHTMFFLNAGVQLTTTNTETVVILKEFESKGVELYSCGTCLKHYSLESELKVGRRGTTNHIVEGLQDFDKVVWI